METCYKKGVFKQELKNRFLCLVNIDGIDTICYIPSSSRLENYVNLIGKEVLLHPTQSSSSRTKFSVFAIKKNRNYIFLNTSIPNSVIAKDLHKKRYAFLGPRNNIQREKIIDDYKTDIYIEDTKTIIEVKSIITDDKNAVFPTVHSERAIDQLRKLSSLLDDGYKVQYCFASLNPYVNRISLNENEEEYYKLLVECLNKGMNTYGCTIELKNGVPSIKKTIDIVIANTK